MFTRGLIVVLVVLLFASVGRAEDEPAIGAGGRSPKELRGVQGRFVSAVGHHDRRSGQRKSRRGRLHPPQGGSGLIASQHGPQGAFGRKRAPPWRSRDHRKPDRHHEDQHVGWRR